MAGGAGMAGWGLGEGGGEMGVRSGCWAPVQLRGPRQEGSRPSVCWAGGGW